MKRVLQLFAAIALLIVSSCTNNQNTVDKASKNGEVNFNSSDEELNSSWEWAKKTALSYVHDGDPVGLWYEAALPGREAFCMRDVSHQSTGAAVLGLDEHTKNMLLRFAENISESKDWCSYWEINKDGVPAPVDYKNDKDFWYNLPANFDVLDACMRMYMWTGDTAYIHNPVFLNFYHRSMNDYVEKWELEAAGILERNRIMNLPEGATEDNHHYYDKRGIPGYHEGANGNMKLGIDLLAAQYAANAWYNFKIMNAEKNSRWDNESKFISAIINNIFWDEQEKKFKIILYEDGSFGYTVGDGQDFAHMLLYYNTLDELEMINSVLDHYSEDKSSFIIEIASYLPDIFFRYGRPEDGLFMLKYLTSESTNRREYPENPFSVVGAFVSGLMGLTPDAENNYIITFSGLTDPESWATVSELPVLGGKIDLMHYGRHTSVFTNHSNDTMYWVPYLEGVLDKWYINDKPDRRYGQESAFFDLKVTTWLIPVAPKSTASVSAFPRPEQP